MDAAFDRVFDWTSFQRLDNAAVVDFLASHASALCEAGIISRKETDDLRVALSTIHGSPDTRSRPLLLELERQHGDFLTILVSRYGVSALSLNLLRHTLGARLGETRRILAEMGQALIGRAELLFNRPFRLYSAEKQEKKTLFSAVLVEWAEQIADAEERLGQIGEELALLIGHEMAGSRALDQGVDESVARALGFRGVIYPVLLGHRESEVQRELSTIMGTLARVSALFVRQLAQNVNSEAVYGALATTEWLAGEAARLEHPDLLEGANLFAMEMRRRHLLSTLTGIHDSLIQLMILLMQCLSGSEGMTPKEAVDLSEATARRIAFEMIASGTAPHHAVEGARALFRYLAEHHIHPKDILVGELARIHSALTPTTLETLVTLTSASSRTLDPHPEKDQAMTKAGYLLERFARVLAATSVAMLPFVLLTTACGLKTHLRSEVVEFRPDIPFRDTRDAQEGAPFGPVKAVPATQDKLRRP